MRSLRTFALRNLITSGVCALALVVFLGSGLSPASGSKDLSPLNANENTRVLPTQPQGNDAALSLDSIMGAGHSGRKTPLKLLPVGAASPFATTLTATKTDNLAQTATVNPGDTIMYTVTITNTGALNADNVNFTDTIDVNTTLVPASVVTSPIAVNDTYNTIGNVNISVPAPGVLSNDLDPNGGSAVIVAPFPTTSTNGGTVSLNADGSFTYNPPVGFKGTDTFTYTAGNGTGKTDTATVSITVSGMMWFVNSAAVLNGDGRLTSPFNVLSSAAAVDAANDVIFLYTSATNYTTAGITLESSEILIGQGAGQSILTITGFTAPSGTNLLPATNNVSDPVITTAGTVAITLGTNNKLHGFTVGDTGAAGTDISGSSFGNLTVRDVSVKGTGRALNLQTGTIVTGSTFDLIESNGGSPAEGVRLNGVTGSFTSTTTNIVNPTGTGIDVQSSTVVVGGFNFGATTVNKNSTPGTGVNLATNTGTFSFSSLAVTTSAGTGVSATSSGTVNVTAGSINTTGGAGALVVTSTAMGMTFSTGTPSVRSTNSTNGITLTSATGTLTIASPTITSPTAIGISETSSSATVNYGNTTANSSGSTGVVLSSNTGTITFGALSIAPASGQRGLLAQLNTNTIKSTSGTISTTNNTAVEISGTSNATRTPLNMVLTSVSAAGNSPNGIFIQHTSATGVPGGFVVNGGTISNTTGVDGANSGIGVRLENANKITLSGVTISGTHQNFGIRGINVNGFTMTNTSVTGTMGTNNALDEAPVSFTQLLGTATITGGTFSGSIEDNFRLVNTSVNTANPVATTTKMAIGM